MPRVDDPSGLRQQLADQLPQLAPGTLRQVATEVPFYRDLSAQQFDVEVAGVIEQNLELFARLLREERGPLPGEITFIVRSAARRAEEHIPLPEILAAYYTGMRWCWQQLREFIPEADVATMTDVGDLVLSYLQAITVAVTDVYVETTTALYGRERESRSVLLRHLLAGTDDLADWEAVGLTPWDECTVVCLRLPPAPGSDEVARAIAARRRVGTVRDAVGKMVGVQPLDDLGSTGGALVVPGVVSRARLADALGGLLGTRWHAGLAVAQSGEAMPDALAAARDCAEVAERLHYASGVHELSDLLLEVQVTRPGPARAALGQLLSPLEETPELLDTLRAHVAAHGKRAETARQLHVHPNTLDYRLRRVAELIAVDPATPDGAQMVRAALVVREYLALAPRRRPGRPRTRRAP